MSSAKSSWSKWSSVSVAFLALAAFALPALGQEAAETSAPGGSYVDDWSHHHLVFSNPGTREDAVKNGTLDKWLKITSDPRYQLQLAKRKMGALPVVADPNAATADRNLDTKTVDAVGGMAARPVAPARPRPVPENPIEKDWSQSLGGSTTSLEVTLAAGSSTTVGPTSTITVGTQTFTTSQPETASGTIAIGSANCIAPGTGVAINGVDITTSATGENATLTISSDPGAGTKVVVPGGRGVPLTSSKPPAPRRQIASKTPAPVRPTTSCRPRISQRPLTTIPPTAAARRHVSPMFPPRIPPFMPPIQAPT